MKLEHDRWISTVLTPLVDGKFTTRQGQICGFRLYRGLDHRLYCEHRYTHANGVPVDWKADFTTETHEFRSVFQEYDQAIQLLLHGSVDAVSDVIIASLALLMHLICPTIKGVAWHIVSTPPTKFIDVEGAI